MAHQRGQKESIESARRILAVQHEHTALELRKAGASFAAIAAQLRNADGSTFSPEGARQAVKRGLARLNLDTDESAEDLRKMEEERLDVMLLAIWEKARRGDLQAIDRVLKITETRAKLCGLYAATQMEHSGLTLNDENKLNNVLVELLVELSVRMTT